MVDDVSRLLSVTRPRSVLICCLVDADELFERLTDELFERLTDELFERLTDELFERLTDELFERLTDELLLEEPPL